VRRRRPYGACSYRDLALEALVCHPDLSRRDVRTLRACWVRQHRGTGRLVISLPSEMGERLAYLGERASAALLDYLEASRLWGEDAPLFPGR